MTLLDKYLTTVENTDPQKFVGRVTRVQGLLIEALGPQAVVGELCRIELGSTGPGQDAREVWAEVVGLHGKVVQLMPYQEVDGLEIGCRVKAMGESLHVAVSDKLLGRVLDGMGHPIDGKGEIGSTLRYPAVHNPPEALDRGRIHRKVATGVRSIDALIPLGRGQRMGIFAGSGVGKSTLLGMIARNTSADINVVALIGERGREVNEFIESELGEEGLKRSVIIVSTSNTPALARLRGAYVATAVAEYFRDQGKDVMLLFDSVTRFAYAQREIGLAVGEPPARQGYTPSVFSLLPKLLERAGTAKVGTITGLYTILVDGDDMDDPIADSVRGILDGHIVLSRRLAERSHYPAVDVLKSVSRLAGKITSPLAREAFQVLRRHLAVYTEAEDLINAGAYAAGSNPEIDLAIKKYKEIREFLVQKVEEKAPYLQTLQRAAAIAGLAAPEASTEDA
ncbi:MAG: FliI/YscN family ATPase [Spirochaetales bacterium]